MENTALVLIDIQNDYFPGGKNELWEAEACADRAAAALLLFREKGLTVAHVRHESAKPNAPFFVPGTHGAQIHNSVQPQAGEIVILKHAPDGFLRTELGETLNALHASRLVICGMMSHMCVDTTVRTANSLGYSVLLLSDACTTKDLAWNGERIPAHTVHAAFMAALHNTFATVIRTAELEAAL
jgi:nicotinamidase-related amidase